MLTTTMCRNYYFYQNTETKMIFLCHLLKHTLNNEENRLSSSIMNMQYSAYFIKHFQAVYQTLNNE